MISNWFNRTKIEDSHPTEETLLACVDGELSEKEAARVRRHLENCWSCRAQLDELEETITLFVNFRSQIQNPLAAPPPNDWGGFERKLAPLAAATETGKNSVPRRAGFLGKFRQSFRFSEWSPVRKQFGIGATAAVLIVALLWQMVSVRSVSAAELLNNSIRSEQQKIERVNQPVVYQKLRLESAGAKSVNWETWRDAVNSRYRSAVEDERSGGRHFISAAFNPEKNDSPDEPMLREVAAILKANRMNAAQPLSAESFQIWRNSLAEKRDEIENLRARDGSQSYILKTIAAGATENGKITEAALTVDAEDWHAEKLRLSVKNANGESVYEFVETAFEVVSLPALNPEIFPPDLPPAQTVIASASPNSKPSPAVSPSDETLNEAHSNLILQSSPTNSNASATLAATATAELEVEVLKALNGIGADIGEEATVTRTAANQLLVQGIVESPERKSEIARALAPLTGQPGLIVRIETSVEAQKRIEREQTLSAKNKPSRRENDETGVSVQPLDIRDRIPADAETRRYLRSKGTAENNLNDEVNRFATRTINRSNQVLLRALALKNLASRFSEAQLRAMKPEARNQWLNLIQVRAAEIENQNAALREELGAVFGGIPTGGASIEVSEEAGLKRAVVRLSELASGNDRAIRAAFTFSSGANSDAVKGSQFRQSLGSIEGLAIGIQTAARKLQSKQNGN